MKKIIIIGLTLLMSGVSFAQSDGENNVKNFRFGLKGNLSLDWIKPENEKKFTSGGSALGYGWGIQMEYRLNQTVSVVSGFGIQTAKGKIKYNDASSKDSTYYILNRDAEFIDFNKDNFSDSTKQKFLLLDRKYAINYVNIPIALKMKTKEIGYITYYGTFGLNLGIKTKARVKDQVKKVSNNVINYVGDTLVTPINVDNLEMTNDKLDATKGISPLRAGLLIGGGGEYTIAGTTALFFDLTYNYFFTNTVKKHDKYLGVRDYEQPKGYKEITQKFIPGSVTLTVGILF